MRCVICREIGHEASSCPQQPAALGKRDFTEQERRAKEREIRDVEEGFFVKLGKVIGKVPFVLDAVAMYYTMLDAKTPFWVKASVAGALAYFISPIDAIPDVLPIVGYSDDAAVIYMTMSLIHSHITAEHIAQAKDVLKVA